jgi:hypothetical protein
MYHRLQLSYRRDPTCRTSLSSPASGTHFALDRSRQRTAWDVRGTKTFAVRHNLTRSVRNVGQLLNSRSVRLDAR